MDGAERADEEKMEMETKIQVGHRYLNLVAGNGCPFCEDSVAVPSLDEIVYAFIYGGDETYCSYASREELIASDEYYSVHPLPDAVTVGTANCWQCDSWWRLETAQSAHKP